MTKVTSIASTLALLAAAAGCSAGNDGSATGVPLPGAASFTSQPPGGGMGEKGALSANAPGGSNSGGGAEDTATRTIQESDLYAVAGNTLYVLNTFRGLMIVDMTDLTAPQLVGRVPIVGNPVGLYVEGTKAYVIVSDYFFYDFVDDFAGGAASLPWLGSQVWAIDVSIPASPIVLSKLPVNGSIDDSRIVGNILYVVSNVYAYQYAWGLTGAGYGNTTEDLTFVASFDLSNSAQLKPVGELDFPSAGWDIHQNVTQNRIVISEAGWDQASGQPITRFQPIDISDPAGALTLGTEFQAAGMVSDRWAMDFDPSTNLFRAVLNSNWGNSGGTLQIWTAPDIHSATLTGTLNLNLPEAVTAVSYDGTRAYIVTAYCTDPLFIVDTANPAAPKVTGSVTLSGALDFLVPMGNRIVALGHDSSGCVAWEGAGPMAVSLFDVTDATKPSLLSRVDFGSGYSSVNASQDDLKKAFQVLNQLGLILVPFQSWNYTDYSYQGGTQLIDLSATKLTLRGFAAQQGSIERAFPLPSAPDKIVAFSNRSLQILDVSDRDQPAPVSRLDMARPVLSVTPVNGQLVELSGDWTLGDTELVVTNADTPDQAVPSAVVPIPAPNAQTFRDGNVMWILANDTTNGVAWLQAVDVTNPSAPTLRGKISIDPSWVPYSYGGWAYWGYGDEAVLAGHALAIHRSYYGCYGCQSPSDQIYVVDLTNPDAPALAPPLILPESDWSWGLTAIGSFAWITHYEWLPDSNYGRVRYYLDRVDLTDPQNPRLLPKINVPGVFFAASTDGKTIYTQDTLYTENWSQVSTLLHELTLRANNNSAVLVRSLRLSGYPGSAALNGGFAYLETWDWGASQTQATLTAIDLNGLKVTSSQTVASSWAWILKATGGKLFLEAGWYDNGILIYDLENPGKPTYQGTDRIQGWVQDVVVSGATAYLPSGDYGTPMINLTPGSLL